ncbi:septum formation initiator family protein [Marinibaculum pumilum]|uniref:Septum formation initiator family protein n=1 Tax=Marinibaculum pumilum TaxID=1766165 RepID=A0ABV7KUF1_9PROT
MRFLDDIRRRATQAVMPVVCLGAIAYFGYHAVVGDRGVHSYRQLETEIEIAEAALAKTVAERERLERRVNLFHADGLDPDLLEEEARLMLGLVRENEVVILLPQQN